MRHVIWALKSGRALVVPPHHVSDVKAELTRHGEREAQYAALEALAAKNPTWIDGWPTSTAQARPALMSRPRAAQARALAKQIVALAAEKSDQGDTDGAIDVLNKLIKRTDLPEDVRALLTKARDRLVAKGDAPNKKPDTKASVASLKAKIGDLRKTIHASKETRPTMSKQTESDRATRKAEMDARMGMPGAAPDISLGPTGQIIFGAISKEDGRILQKMDRAILRGIAAAPPALKAKLWNAAKGK
jgi:hypothetical protein